MSETNIIDAQIYRGAWSCLASYPGLGTKLDHAFIVILFQPTVVRQPWLKDTQAK